LPSIKILTWGVSSFPLGLYFAKNLPKRITPLFPYLHTALYLSRASALEVHFLKGLKRHA
jgi:hypothetical protein